MAPRPPTKTGAFAVFATNINRARAFLRIFAKDADTGRGRGQPSNDEKELLRGSLVFAIGALDAYLSDLILEIVPKHAPHNKRVQEALTAIAKSDPGLALRMTLIDDGPARREEFSRALDAWLESKSFHGPEKVMAALEFVGCSDLKWPQFDVATGVKTADALDKATAERHGIVHRGEKPNVKQDEVKAKLDLVETIAKVVDAAVLKAYS